MFGPIDCNHHFFQQRAQKLRPGDSVTILVDGFVNRLQESQSPEFVLFKLRGLSFYPGGILTHCSCQPSLDAHLTGVIYHKPVVGSRANC